MYESDRYNRMNENTPSGVFLFFMQNHRESAFAGIEAIKKRILNCTDNRDITENRYRR